MVLTPIAIIFLVLFLLSFVGMVFFYLGQNKWKAEINTGKALSEELNSKIFELQSQKESLEKELHQAEKNEVELSTKLNQLKESLTEQQKLQKELQSDFEKTVVLKFEQMATKILDEKSEGYRKSNQDELKQILFPLKERITEFQNKVEQTYQSESREIIQLKEQLKRMFEISDRMSHETVSLTKALKGDVKMQGNWGEIVLGRILESSGLREGEEYIAEGRDLKLKTDDGRHLRPDVIINLPEEKHLVIDSKVSLVHFEAIGRAESEEEMQSSQKLFIDSVNKHIDGLSGKKYQNNDKLLSPDFVLMFFPIEAAYAMALQLDSNLFQRCWEKNIVIVGPTTLLATLKTVASLWKQERQNKNALLIASECGKLYDKFVGFIEDLNKIGESLNRTEITYNEAMKKLQTGRGNIVSRFERIKDLGAKATKKIPKENINSDTELLTE